MLPLFVTIGGYLYKIALTAVPFHQCYQVFVVNMLFYFVG